MRSVHLCLALLCVFLRQPVAAQTTNPSSFQQQAAAAFSSGGGFPASVALSGSATWTAGSLNETGTLNLQASADGSASENWTFPTVSHALTQSALGNDPTGASRSCTYTDAKGTPEAFAGPNCARGVPWFFPSFIWQPAYAAAVTVSDQTDDADTAQGLRKLRYSPAASASSVATVLSTGFTIYYDTKTALPARLVYQQAFDNDISHGIEVAIVYSSYRLESGFMVPHHIQRYLQQSLNADFTLSTATIQ